MPISSNGVVVGSYGYTGKKKKCPACGKYKCKHGKRARVF